MKRFRNSRPSEEEVHERTLGLLYSAQHRPSTLQQQQVTHEQDVSDALPPADAAAPPKAQNSLHRFWNISSAPTAPINSVGQTMSASLDCEDCGCSLHTGGDDHMDVDGEEAGGASCSACAKRVCFSCSVSNLGQQRRCLQCASRPKVWVGGIGWTNPQ